jgi:small neutral amino acid transporter SnatA (MarC family)
MTGEMTLTFPAAGIIPASIIICIVLTYNMMKNSDYIVSRIGQKECRAIKRSMGILLIAIAYRNRCEVHHRRYQDRVPPAQRRQKMAQDWDLTSVGMILIGSSITVAGTIIAVMLLGISLPKAPFLLITTASLVVMSAALVLFGNKSDVKQ